MKKFITDLGVVPGNEGLISLYDDNNGVIAQAKEPRSHPKSKHILRRFHLIKEIMTQGDITVERVPFEDNIVDPLTKLLSHIVFKRQRGLIGIKHRGD